MSTIVDGKGKGKEKLEEGVLNDGVLDLGHIPLPSPLLYETRSLLRPHPVPSYTITVHLAHPGQKVEYEMDNMTGHLLVLVYPPNRGFEGILGVIGGGAVRAPLPSPPPLPPPGPSGSDTTAEENDSDDSTDDAYASPLKNNYDYNTYNDNNYDNDYYDFGNNTASAAGGIWIPQLFDWNGLRVLDWGSVSGKFVLQFPEFIRIPRNSTGWGEEREVMPVDRSEVVMEISLAEADLQQCVLSEEAWGWGAGRTKSGKKDREHRKGVVVGGGSGNTSRPGSAWMRQQDKRKGLEVASEHDMGEVGAGSTSTATKGVKSSSRYDLRKKRA